MTERLLVSQGRSSAAFTVNKFGYAEDVAAGGLGSDVWDYHDTNTFWNIPTVAQAHNFVSTSINDDVAGTNARTIVAQGIDENGDRAEEEIDLDGTVPVPGSQLFQSIHRMYVKPGTGGSINQGRITATGATDGTVTAAINALNGQTLMAVYKVPAGFNALLNRYYVSVHRSGGVAVEAEAKLRVADPGESYYRIRHGIGLMTTGSSYTTQEFGDICPSFEPLSIIKIGIVVSQICDVYAGFDLTCVRTNARAGSLSVKNLIS